LFAWQAIHADTQSLRVVNAASFLENASLAPGAIISIFGPHLANTTASATDPSNLPHTLGGVTVSIGSTTLPLFYVTKTQINARIDPAVITGAATLTIQSTTGTFTKDIVISANSTPGLFAMNGAGTRDGAIENALTFDVGPFTVTTNGSPTYLAIYATGLDLSSQPSVTIGGVSVPVQFYGAAPCCPGLQQINVELTPTLAGAGRVEVAVTAGGQTSNVVEVVILPEPGQGSFPPQEQNRARSRELASLAWIPGTSTALIADENDDVVRLLDVKQKQVTKVITLPQGASPVAVAVNAAGTLAVVAERGRASAAVIDLGSDTVKAEVGVQGGPSAVAIAGKLAAVVNQDSDSVSVVDLTTSAVTNVGVGRGPRGIAVDATANKAYVTNEDDGTLSVVDLSSLSAEPTVITLNANARPAAIQFDPALGVLVITEPSAGPRGQVIVLTIASEQIATINVNPDKTGGASDVDILGSNAYFADQAGGSVTVVALPDSAPTMIKADIGARALAVDALDKLLLVANEGSGTITLIDLNSNTVVGNVDGVRGPHEAENNVPDDYSDRQEGQNAPAITSINPASATAGSSFTLTITGTNLIGVSAVMFIDPSSVPEQGHGKAGGNGHAPMGTQDPNITVTNIQVNAAGTQVTVSVTIAAAEGKCQRLVLVVTPNGDSSSALSTANTFLID
jgi:uncharacterized protein (TIGR03437 family)